MLGWKEDLGFDGFSGKIGKLEPDPQPQRLNLNEMLYGVGGEK